MFAREIRVILVWPGITIALAALLIFIASLPHWILAAILVSACLSGTVSGVRIALQKQTRTGAGLAICILASAGALLVVVFAVVYLKFGLTVDEGRSGRLATLREALYFSTVTWTTLGYGDIKPNNATKFYAAMEAVVGYLYMGVFVSLLSRLMTIEPSPNSDGSSGGVATKD